MASTIGKVRAVFTASTSGLVSATDQAAAAFKRLGGDSNTLQSALAKLSRLDAAGIAKVGPSADAAAQRLAAFSGLIERAQEALRLGTITSQEFAAKMAAITTAADQAAAALTRGAEVTKKFQTAEQQLASTVAEYDDLLRRGAITQEIYSRAVAEAQAQFAKSSGLASAAEQAERSRQETLARGAQVANQFATAEETLASRTAEFNELLSAGAITAETHARAIASIQEQYLRASGAAEASAQAERERQAVISRGADVTRSLQTAQETYASAVSELSGLLSEGAISVGTYERGVARAQETFDNATGVTAAQARAMDDLTQAMNRGQSITQQVATAEERYADTVEELNSLLRRGAISQNTYERAVSQATAELERSKSGADTFAAGARQVQSSVGSVINRLNLLIAIQGAQLFGSIIRGISDVIRSFVDLGRSQAETIDSTGKLADRLGFTYGELAGIGFAGELAGVSIDQVAAAATKADVAFVKAAQGSKVAVAAFASIGLSLDDLNGLTAADRFNVIIEAIAALPTEAERSAAAVRLFGRSGAELLPLFNEGAAGIQAAREQADRLGLTLTGAQFRSVERMNDAFTEAYSAIRGVIGQVVAYLSPAVTSVSQAFTDLIGNVGGATIGQTIGEGILTGARSLAQIGDALIANLGSVWSYVSQVGQQWSAVLSFGQTVAQIFYGAWKSFELVGNVVGGIFSDIIAGLLSASASAAELIPGLGDFAAGLRDSSNAWTEQGDRFHEAAQANAQAAADSFTNAIFGNNNGAESVGQAIAGPITTAIDQAAAAARDAASQVDTSLPQTVEVRQSVNVTASEAIKGVDSRSREGIDLMFKLIRGEQDNLQEEQLAALREIAANTSDMGLDVEAVDLAPAAGI